jgi:hypothetical protein
VLAGVECLLALNDVMGFDSIGLFANKLTIPKFQPLARDPGKKKGGLGHPVLFTAVSTLWHQPVLALRSGVAGF